MPHLAPLLIRSLKCILYSDNHQSCRGSTVNIYLPTIDTRAYCNNIHIIQLVATCQREVDNEIEKHRLVKNV